MGSTAPAPKVSCMSPVLLASFASALAAASSAEVPEAQVSEAQVPAVVLPVFDQALEPPALQLTIKLEDAVQGRIQADGTLHFAAPVDAQLTQGFAELTRGLTLTQRIQLPAHRLDALAARAQARSGHPQPDLAGILLVEPPTPRSPTALAAVGARLQAHPLVERAFVGPVAPPPPSDVAPETPDYTARQAHLDEDPGLDFAFAWSHGVTGSGVRVSDCEYAAPATHEDLAGAGVGYEPGQTVHPDVLAYNWDDHYTAVMGALVAPHNGYGISGMVPDASGHGYPEYTEEEGWRRATAIARAIEDSDVGDVVVLEMQTYLECEGCYGPAELDPDVWDLTRLATDAGVVVVAAAGNGAVNLDSSFYADVYTARGSSGAILVGAGSADDLHDALYFSTYGSRVDLQGWGEDVVTLAYGDLARHGNDDDQAYTARFGGTSSATPLVAAAVVAVQSHALTLGIGPLSPEELRDVLVDTGIAQGSGDPVGPFPDVATALRTLDADMDGHAPPELGGDDCDDTDATVALDCDGTAADTGDVGLGSGGSPPSKGGCAHGGPPRSWLAVLFLPVALLGRRFSPIRQTLRSHP